LDDLDELAKSSLDDLVTQSIDSEEGWTPSSNTQEDVDYDDDEEDEYEYSDCDEEDLEFDESATVSKTQEYIILDREAIVKQQQLVIVNVSSLLELDHQQARFVLMHFRWSEEKVQAAFFDHGKEQLLLTSGVFVPSDTSGANCDNSRDSSAMITCQMCIDELPRSECEAMACGHLFCNACWGRYLKIQIDEGQSCHIHCPSISPKKCSVMCDEAKVVKLVEPISQARYADALINNFVDSNKLTKWCPGRDCGRAIKSDDMNRPIEVCIGLAEALTPQIEIVCVVFKSSYSIVCTPQVRCDCSHSFCFKCTEPAHTPATCAMIRLWKIKAEDDSETEHWKKANTKQVHIMIACWERGWKLMCSWCWFWRSMV
jgi:ariadne-1